MLKSILYLIPVAALVLGGVYYFVNKPVKSLKNAKPAFELSAENLFSEFSDDETSANTKYLDQVIQVSGTVLELKDEGDAGYKVLLNSGDEMFGVTCEIDPAISFNPDQYQAGKEVTLKGLCTGILMDVIMVRCVPEN